MVVELNLFTWGVITVGALIGSVKANLDDKEPSKCIRLFNVVLGLFCGVALAGEYSNGISPYLSGLLALIGGMLGGTALDVISELAPGLIKKYISRRFK